MSGENAVRSAEYIGGQELSYAEVKAIASGNPSVLTLAEADAELQRLSILKKNHADEQFLARRNLRELPTTISALKRRLSNLNADLETLMACANDPIIIGEQHLLGDDVVPKLGHNLDSLTKHVREIRRFPLGVYRGLHFGLVRDPQWAPELYLEGEIVRQSRLSREHHGPRAVLNALERLAGSYESECDRVRQDLTIAEAQLRDYEERLGKPFPHEKYLSQLTAVRDRLKACLSGVPLEPIAEQQSSASELAEEIKALYGSNIIDATPKRVGNRYRSAGESVTSRIRRRMAVVFTFNA